SSGKTFVIAEAVVSTAQRQREGSAQVDLVRGARGEQEPLGLAVIGAGEAFASRARREAEEGEVGRCPVDRQVSFQGALDLPGPLLTGDDGLRDHAGDL